MLGISSVMKYGDQEDASEFFIQMLNGLLQELPKK